MIALQIALPSRSAPEVGDEGAVDLDRVERELLERHERRGAGAEVVDDQTDADLVQLRAARDRTRRGSWASVSSVTLEPDRARREPRLRDDPLHLSREHRLGELAGGDVDVELEGLARAAVPLRHLEARLLERPRADVDDRAGALGIGQELRREQQPAVGVVPANQRLEARRRDRWRSSRSAGSGATARRVRARSVNSSSVTVGEGISSEISMHAPPSSRARFPALSARPSTFSGRSCAAKARATPMLAVTSATPVDDERRMRDPHRDALGERLGGVTVGHVTAHEDEPLGVHVRDDVARTGHRAEPGRDRFEELRTGRVAEPFVDRGEVVELDRHHGDASEGDLAVGEPPAQAVEVEDRDPRLTGIPVALEVDGVGSATGSGEGSVDPGGAAAKTAASVIGAGGMPGIERVERVEGSSASSAPGGPRRPGSATNTAGSRSWATRAAARRARRLARSATIVAADGHRGRDRPRRRRAARCPRPVVGGRARPP